MMQLIGNSQIQRAEARRNAAGLPEYRSSANSTSVITPARRQSLAEEKHGEHAAATKFHQSQFPAIPLRATMPVTAKGYRRQRVATMDVPPATRECCAHEKNSLMSSTRRAPL